MFQTLMSCVQNLRSWQGRDCDYLLDIGLNNLQNVKGKLILFGHHSNTITPLALN